MRVRLGHGFVRLGQGLGRHLAEEGERVRRRVDTFEALVDKRLQRSFELVDVRVELKVVSVERGLRVVEQFVPEADGRAAEVCGSGGAAARAEGVKEKM